MENGEEDDVQLLRASAGLLIDLNALLKRILWKTSRGTGSLVVHRLVRQRDLDAAIAKIELFQGDPQLLDTSLGGLLPPLVDAYLASLRHHAPVTIGSNVITLRHAVCKILYTFCKVRGEKVIVGFLNNEARHLEPILTVFEHGTRAHTSESEVQEISWEERYILLLWISHLMLAPFDLSSISSLVSDDEPSSNDGLALPKDLPSIVLRVLPICIASLRTSTRERSAASTLLARTCLRPDMRKAGLLDAVVPWCITQTKLCPNDAIGIHQSLGLLTFLSKLVSSGNHEEIGGQIASIFNVWQAINEGENMAAIRNSAVARKLNVKLIRCIVILCLQEPVPGLDTTMVVEEAIGYLLEALADGDSPVRMAASKAISVITLQLGTRMAGEVSDVVLGSFNEDVLWTSTSRNLSAVNPLRWHGLTLTLGHLLYRRAIAADKLPELLNALIMALNFEQRSAMGSSIGTNVRDAANFGIWALSRRYTTGELLAFDISSVKAMQTSHSQLSVLQAMAIQLVQSACLDPAGNIRRGSSAALQELIGRHPDTVSQGIPLVQVVDYQAVGLRERAMTEVAISAAQLDSLYWESIFTAVLGWRGIGAVDSPSRVFAAKAIGRLSSTQPDSRVKTMSETIIEQLQELASRQVEERQGLLVALAELINASRERLPPEMTDVEFGSDAWNAIKSALDTSLLDQMWEALYRLDLSEKDFTSMAMRPELTATAVCDLLQALSKLAMLFAVFNRDWSPTEPYQKAERLLDACLQRPEDTVAKKAADAISHWTALLPRSECSAIVASWLKALTAPSLSMRKTGHPEALGAAWRNLQGPTELAVRVVATLCNRCSTEFDIEARVVAVKSLGRVCEGLNDTEVVGLPPSREGARLIWQALDRGLNDYTINERGDVGSLVRLEALNVVEFIWSELNWAILLFPHEDDVPNDTVALSVFRLSLEKLDKVRNRAAKCLEMGRHSPNAFAPSPISHKLAPFYQQESLYAYYSSALSILQNKERVNLNKAIVLGFISAAGMGFESVLQPSRAAIVDNLARAPAYNPGELSIDYFMNVVSTILEENLAEDRIILPLLDFVAFVLDMRIPQRLCTHLPGQRPFKWLKLLSLVQKSHYKSSNLQKLHLVLDVYRGLADIPVLRTEVLKKVVSMLLHAFPKVRFAAAQTLFVILKDQDKEKETLKSVDLTQSLKMLKPVVDKLRARVDDL